MVDIGDDIMGVALDNLVDIDEGIVGITVDSRDVEALNYGQQRPLSLFRRGSKSHAKLSTEAEALCPMTDSPLVGCLGVITERLMT